jgi:hypothetical protein
MKQSGKFFPGWPAADARSHQKNESRGRQQRALSLEDDQPYKERGYNPYDTISQVGLTRGRDVWRSKPKRA